MDSENYTLNGMQIFGTEFTNNIDAKYIERFKNISACINNYNNFQTHSKLENLLKMEFNLPPNNPGIEQISRILSNKFGNTNCDMFIGAEPTICLNAANSTGIVTIPDVISVPITLDESNNLSNTVINANTISLRDQILSSITSSDTTARDMHKSFFRNMCLELFKAHYRKLYTNRDKFNFDNGLSVADLNNVQLTELVQNYYSIIESISIDIDSFNSNGPSNYYSIVCEEIANYSMKQTNNVSNPIFYNLFLNCYYPYILFCYIIGQIPLIESGTSNDKAPRFFILRRLAIAFSYVFEFYTVLTLYNTCSVALKVNAELILESVNTCMMKELLSTQNSTYTSLHSDNLTNVESSRYLADINRDISLSQNNLNKAIINDKGIEKKHKNSYVFMWLWIAFYIVFILTFTVFVIFLNSTDKIQYMYIASTLVAISIFITIIVDMLN